MQNFSNILTQFDDIGLVFSLGENNLLKVTPKEKITDQARLFIQGHKAEIVLQLERRQHKNAPKLDAPNPRSFTKKKGETISSVALKWLQAHKQELHQAGWTGRELYRRNKSRGICWCQLWDAPYLKVYLHDNGVIELECIIEGRDCIKITRPMHQGRKLTKS